jgi:hypothetical protein
MKPNNLVHVFTISTVAGLLAACGKKNSPQANQNPPPAAQQPVQQPAPQTPATPAPNPTAPSENSYDAALVQRIMARSTGLIMQKKFAEARLTLNQLDTMTLTPSQQAAANNLKAQIPANQ